MLFFGSRKLTAERLQERDWRTRDERDALLAELEASEVTTQELMPLLTHDDARVREVTARMFGERAGQPR